MTRRDPSDASHLFAGMLPGTRGTPLPSRRPRASRLTARPSTTQDPSITRHPTGNTAATIPAKEKTMSAATKGVVKDAETAKAGMNAAEFQKAHLAKKAAEAEAKAAAKAAAAAAKAEKVAADKAARAEAALAKAAEREAAKAAKGAETDAAKAIRLEAAAKAKAERDAAKAIADAARKEKNAARDAEIDRLRKLGPDDTAHCERGDHDAPVKSFPTTRTGAGRSFHECRACRDARVKAAKAS